MPVILDRYRVTHELSTTLYGWVFACEDAVHNTDSTARDTPNSSVVIKQVSLERMVDFMQSHPSDGHTPDNPIVERKIGDLVRAAGGHPNLIQYKDSFVEQQTLYLVLEHCANGDLYNYLSKRQQRNMTCMDALNVLSQVASGLAFLHELGIAHLDVSLENILLHRGRCKLGDFGLSTREHRRGGRLVGKNNYMAPEIVAGDAYDPKPADVWSLGIVLFIMLTGSPLVSLASASVKSFRALKRSGVVRVLQSWGMAAALPTGTLNLLSGMLESDPSKRLTITQVLAHDAFKESLE